MEELCQQIAALTDAVKDLQGRHYQLESRLNALVPLPEDAGPSALPAAPPGPSAAQAAAPSESPEPRVPAPERFSGDRSKYRAFLNACRVCFLLQPRTFASETAKVGFMISLLLGEPQSWAHRLLEQRSPLLNSERSFCDAMSLLYDDPHRAATAEATLHSLHQGRRPVEDYVAEFRRWSTDTDWNPAALRHQFRLGLSDTLKDELARVGIPDSVEELIRLSIQIDRRLRERRFERSHQPRPAWMLPQVSRPQVSGFPAPVARPANPNDVPEPMQLGILRAPLSVEEKNRRRQLNLCLYCGEHGHYANTCPNKPRKSPPSAPVTTVPACVPKDSYITIPVSLQLPEGALHTQAIIDSGACSCFMDLRFAQLHRIPLTPKARSLLLRLADGTPINSGPVTQETFPVPASVSPGHSELLRFDVISSPLFPVILGIPWLRAHDPLICWASGTVQFPSAYCAQNCLHSPPVSLGSLQPVDDAPALCQLVPAQYRDFLDVFSKRRADALPPHRPYDCPIELLPGAKIPYGRIYPLSEPELETLKTYIAENLAKGFIQPSTSPAGAGIFFVEKKDHSLRPCVDYRDLNLITIKNRYPLPLVPELFQRLRAATIFTKLDLRGAYNLVRIRKGDEWKTAFRTRFGHYEYRVMPFGLCNAPATFQHLVNDVFRDFLDLFLIVYLDDILIFSPSEDTHLEHVRAVLLRLRQHGLYAKAEKCAFSERSIHFLGFIISTGGIAMDPQKIASILDWPAPADKKSVQRFLGFANFYRRFIKDFSRIILPITQLTKSQPRFHWSALAQAAFDELKELFTTAPVLRHPDPALPFVLEVDASDCALGAVLSQRQGPKSLLHPVAFFSRKLAPPEKNYDVGDRELLAIKAALEEWRYLLEGALHPVLIFTDHRNLEYLRTAKRLNPRQARWALFFTRFHFHITYRPGSKNVKPDALSRMYPDLGHPVPPDTILPSGRFLLLAPDLHAQLQRASAFCPVPSGASLRLQDGLLLHGDRIYVPPDLRLLALQHCHDSLLAGHFGVHKTLDLLRRQFWWPGLATDCSNYVRSCATCLRCKGPRVRSCGLLRPLPIPERPWTMLSMDFIVDLPVSNGYSGIFVVVDRFTKMAHFSPTTGSLSAMATASLFLRDVVRLHGLPCNITSDRGVQFTSRFWKALCTALKIELCFSSAYHPQSNGQTERTNQTLEQYLRCFTSFLQDDWASLLPLAEFAYNNSVHSATQQSPFFANYAYHPTFLPGVLPPSSVPAVQDRLTFLSSNHSTLQAAIAQAQADSAKFFDRGRAGHPDYRPGDLVWLSTAHLPLDCPSRKLGPRFLGPFPVEKRINPVAVRLRLPASFRIHPVFHVSLLKPDVPNSFSARVPAPAPPVVVAGEEEFEVESVLDCRRRYGRLQFLIRWKGYGPEEDSWEPATAVHADRLVRAFFLQHPDRRIALGIRRLPVGRGHCQGARAGRADAAVRMRGRAPQRARARAPAPNQ